MAKKKNDGGDSQEIALKALQLDLEFRNRELAARTAAQAAELAFQQKRMELVELGQLEQQADQFAKTYALSVAELEYQRDLAYRQFGLTEQTTRFDQELQNRRQSFDEQWKQAELTGFLNGVPTLEREQFGESIRQFNVNAILNAPRGPADYAAYMNRMRGLTGSGLMAGAMGQIFGGPGPRITQGGAPNYGMPTPASNTDLAATMVGLGGGPGGFQGNPWSTAPGSGTPWSGATGGSFNLPNLPTPITPSNVGPPPPQAVPGSERLPSNFKGEVVQTLQNGLRLVRWSGGVDGWYDPQGRLIQAGLDSPPPSTNYNWNQPSPATQQQQQLVGPSGWREGYERAENGYYLYGGAGIPDGWYTPDGRFVQAGNSASSAPPPGTQPIAQQQAAAPTSQPAAQASQQQSAAPTGGSASSSFWGGSSAYGDTSQAAVQRMFQTGLSSPTPQVKYGQDVSYQDFRRLSPTEQQYAIGLTEEYGGQPREDFVSQMLSAAPGYQASRVARFGY